MVDRLSKYLIYTGIGIAIAANVAGFVGWKENLGDEVGKILGPLFCHCGNRREVRHGEQMNEVCG